MPRWCSSPSPGWQLGCPAAEPSLSLCGCAGKGLPWEKGSVGLWSSGWEVPGSRGWGQQGEELRRPRWQEEEDGRAALLASIHPGRPEGASLRGVGRAPLAGPGYRFSQGPCYCSHLCCTPGSCCGCCSSGATPSSICANAPLRKVLLCCQSDHLGKSEEKERQRKRGWAERRTG